MEVKVMQDVLGENDKIAESIHDKLAAHGIFVMNLLGSPGSGKTTLLERTLEKLAKEMKIAVIEGDLFTSKDADRIAKHGAEVIQVNTSGGCHLEAPMVEKALSDIDWQSMDMLVIENVGNLVCPAEFALGEQAKVTVLSITEGNDKPMKYPLIFKESSLAILNKVDLLPYTDFSVEEAVEDITTIHPGASVLSVSARTGEGLDAWLDWLRAQVKKAKEAAR